MPRKHKNEHNRQKIGEIRTKKHNEQILEHNGLKPTWVIWVTILSCNAGHSYIHTL